MRSVEVPTLVIHGRDDTLITPEGGTLTAEAIPSATLLLLADMGHDTPEPLWPVIVPTITTFQDLAVGTPSPSDHSHRPHPLARPTQEDPPCPDH